jgi:Protein of unknown function (DUF3558)
MFKKLNISLIQPRRLWMMGLVSAILLLTAACGSAAAATTNPASAPVNAAPTSEAAAVVPTQASAPAGSSANLGNACTLLSQDDVSQVLGVPVLTAVASGLNGVCTYTSSNLSIDFTVAGKTGGMKAMNTDLTRLGDLAKVVPGLGDQAFYNTNAGSALFVLKGDAEFLFNMSDLNYQPLDPAVVQATEKALAEKLLSNLP